MRLIDSLEVNYKDSKRKIELHYGDLTNLHAHEFFDLLIISSIPNDYFPTPSSLIGALDRKGISIDMLARIKELDMRSLFSSWMSMELDHHDYRGIQFRRILCYEPDITNQPLPELIGDIFKGLLPVTEQYGIKSIAMPILATGGSGFPVKKMLKSILNASITWLQRGLNLEKIKIVAYSEAQLKKAQPIFEEFKMGSADYAPRAGTFKYDYFISYSHKNLPEAELFVNHLKNNHQAPAIFFDKRNLRTGHAWQQELFEALDDCRQIFTLISPDYLKSKVCLEEYHIAFFRNRESEDRILMPVYLYSANLPTYMKLVQYTDCREGSEARMKEMLNDIV